MSKRVALVIGSGSVKCAAAIGLQNVLQRAGIEISLLVGCSGGSLYAAAMALGLDAQTIADMTSRLWTREITKKRSWRSLLAVVLPGVFGFDERWGMLDDALVMERLRAAFAGRTFADAKIPLYVAATDLMTGDQIVLSQGSLVDALRASIAMPYHNGKKPGPGPSGATPLRSISVKASSSMLAAVSMSRTKRLIRLMK